MSGCCYSGNLTTPMASPGPEIGSSINIGPQRHNKAETGSVPSHFSLCQKKESDGTGGPSLPFLENIEDREQEYPNDINEVPVQTRTLQKTVLGWRHVTRQRPEQ
jgi:hypothetical protein